MIKDIPESLIHCQSLNSYFFSFLLCFVLFQIRKMSFVDKANLLELLSEGDTRIGEFKVFLIYIYIF